MMTIFFARNQTYFDYLRRFEDGYGISKDEFYEMPKLHPELYEELVRMASKYTKTDKVVDVKPESLISLKYAIPEGGSIAFGILQKKLRGPGLHPPVPGPHSFCLD